MFTLNGYKAEAAYRSFWDDVDPGPLHPSTAKELAYHVCGKHYGWHLQIETFIDGDRKYITDCYGYHDYDRQAGAVAALAEAIPNRVSVRITKYAVNRGQRVVMYTTELDLATPAEREGTA